MNCIGSRLQSERGKRSLREEGVLPPFSPALWLPAFPPLPCTCHFDSSVLVGLPMEVEDQAHQTQEGQSGTHVRPNWLVRAARAVGVGGSGLSSPALSARSEVSGSQRFVSPFTPVGDHADSEHGTPGSQTTRGPTQSPRTICR